MIKKFASTLILSVFLFACNNQKDVEKSSGINEELDAKVYAEKLKTAINAQLVDVRTQEEFSDGHLAGAMNADINSTAFEDSSTKLDKSKPVFVYCLSGGRSSSAAEILAEKGFKEVYNLHGGIMKWNAAGLPLDGNQAPQEGMTIEEFNKKVESKKEFVLIDFNAKWCKPCQQMAPWLSEIADRNVNELEFIKVDADKNKKLLASLGIDGIPVLQLYRNGKKIWEHQGLISEPEFLKATSLK